MRKASDPGLSGSGSLWSECEKGDVDIMGEEGEM